MKRYYTSYLSCFLSDRNSNLGKNSRKKTFLGITIVYCVYELIFSLKEIEKSLNL